MSGDTLASLLYLGLLGVALISYVIVSARQSLSSTAQQLIIWALIFVGAVAGFGLWEDVQRTVSPRQAVFEQGLRVDIPVSADGHYYLTLKLNGAPVDFVVDTGASEMVLSARDASRAGFRADQLDFNGIASTANGTVQTARVFLNKVELGEFVEYEVPAVVNGGALETSLLGMRYLERWGRVEIGGNKMTLVR